MRPVNKGKDLGYFKPYQDAQGKLIEIIGEYCSYCERWLSNAAEVEHILSKTDWPRQKYRWNNFLISCKNCNSGKGYGLISKAAYLWPDRDNTFNAFLYDADGRVLVKSSLPSAIYEKAKNLWELTNLNWHPDLGTPGMKPPSVKDRRFIHRQEAWRVAEDIRADLLVNDSPKGRDTAIKFALQRGFFSIWMQIFSTNSPLDRHIRLALIKAFTGTAGDCFNRLGQGSTRGHC